jgi:hypothetical protein
MRRNDRWLAGHATADALAKRIVAASPPLTIDQEVRLRILRAQ